VDGDEHRDEVAGPPMRGELVEIQLVHEETSQDHHDRRHQKEHIEGVPDTSAIHD
jgi:hypothetical protein